MPGTGNGGREPIVREGRAADVVVFELDGQWFKRDGINFSGPFATREEAAHEKPAQAMTDEARVKAAYPNAAVQCVWAHYYRVWSNGLGVVGNVLGRGATEAEAWANAASRLPQPSAFPMQSYTSKAQNASTVAPWQPGQPSAPAAQPDWEAGRAQHYRDACKLICIYCRDKAHTIWDGKIKPFAAGDVKPIPERIDRQYVPNNGVREGWIHRDLYGYVHDCEAGPIYDALARYQEAFNAKR